MKRLIILTGPPNDFWRKADNLGSTGLTAERYETIVHPQVSGTFF